MRNLNRQHHHGRTVQNKRKQEHNTIIGQTQSQNVTIFRSNCIGSNENKSIRFVILRRTRADKIKSYFSIYIF